MALLLPCAGCSVHELASTTSKNQGSTPAAWKQPENQQPMATAQLKVGEWWEFLGNDELNELIRTALQCEPDVVRACAAVKEASALTCVAHQRLSLFSSKRRLREYCDLKLLESVASCEFDTAALIIGGEVARHYFLYQALHSEVRLLSEALEDREETISIQQSLVDAGKVNEQDLALAKLEAAMVEIDLASSRGDLKTATHALARLTGSTPACFNPPRPRRIATPPQIPEGIPSDLLCRRQDVAAACLMMEAALKDLEEGNRFPSFSLTSPGGAPSNELANLVAKGEQDLLFQCCGTMREEIKNALLARHQKMVAEYDKTLLTAFREVEDALARIQTVRTKLRATEKAGGAAAELVEIARTQFDRGLTTYFNVIEAQRSQLEISRQQNQLQKALNDATIQLIVALGGGC